jgi:hypothetical protein
MEPRNRFQGMNSASLCSLAGRYDNLIPHRFLAPIDSLKIPAPVAIFGSVIDIVGNCVEYIYPSRRLPVPVRVAKDKIGTYCAGLL